MTQRIPSGVPILTAEAMRAAEQACFVAGVAQDELMERAGAAVAREALRFAKGRAVLVLAGPGNNGGDAYVVARLLAERGLDVTVAALGGERKGAAETMRQRWDGPTVALQDAEPRAVLVDGLFGTGMSRTLSDDVRELLHYLVKHSEFSIAIDLPSGVGTDDGADLGAAHMDVTVALGALKPGHVLGAGLIASGHVIYADIGIPCASDCHSIAQPEQAAPARDSHKYSRGLVLVVEGAMPGASRLAARSALHGGAGYVMLAGANQPDRGPDALVFRKAANADSLATLLEDERIAALVIGPGLGRDAESRARMEAALDSEHPLVLDGDALTMLGEAAAERLYRRKAATVLTPHAGEFSRMFSGDGGKLSVTREAARRSGAVIVHKGPDTVIAWPDGRAVVAANGSRWLSTAGTGDVLAGLCGARLAVGGMDAIAGAIWLHGRAAQLAGPAFAADDLIAQVPVALGECR
ncbi:bifunctional ADP-dependent NAD(P)H-hydrate dehydratase/NAD(P)H-hydrate epimerase [Stakelama sediminis]|uniref:Bifunctional NAD(P)H-hydrate repair enzyme n=1 Tax=Stakelama sediminis TaxID=463200 RepID=A0A840YZG0_9SPHN|nr:NAD(P)H-hydrate dehydratase [Stakelama sediminis]MBB5718900.1 hydroxyethylthiazole kinase-like uncharacterized protein yjeF [Stakelama sediminis]